MDNIEIVKKLIGYIGDDRERDWILAHACQILLDEEKPEPKKETQPKEKPKRKTFDMGKLKALTEGGWSAAKIADEMGVSEQTVYNKLKLLKEQ